MFLKLYLPEVHDLDRQPTALLQSAKVVLMNAMHQALQNLTEYQASNSPSLPESDPLLVCYRENFATAKDQLLQVQQELQYREQQAKMKS